MKKAYFHVIVMVPAIDTFESATIYQTDTYNDAELYILESDSEYKWMKIEKVWMEDL